MLRESGNSVLSNAVKTFSSNVIITRNVNTCNLCRNLEDFVMPGLKKKNSKLNISGRKEGKNKTETREFPRQTIVGDID